MAISVKRENSLPLKNRHSLLHKRPATLDVILAVKTLLHQPVTWLYIDRMILIGDLGDNLFDRADGQRRILSDGLAVVQHIAFQDVGWQHPIDQPHSQGLAGEKEAAYRKSL